MRCWSWPCSSWAELLSIQWGVWSAHFSNCAICVGGKKLSKTKTRSRTREKSAISWAGASTVRACVMEQLLEQATGELVRRGRERHQLGVFSHALQLIGWRVLDPLRQRGIGVPDRVHVTQDLPRLIGEEIGR